MNNHSIVITMLSPVHIGDGNDLTSVGEYVVSDNTVRIIDQEHLMQLLKVKKLEKKYIDFILANAENSHVLNFFVENGIEKDIRYSRIIPLNSFGFKQENNNILETAIATKGQKYIPGSSLKGAIRTIIFAEKISSNKNIQDKIEDYILQSEHLYEIKSFVKKIEKDLLDNTFFGLRVSDSTPVKDEDIVVEIARRTHLFGEKTEGLDNLRECIKEGTEIKTDIVMLDERIGPDFSYLQSNDITGIFRVINQITSEVIDHEITLLRKSAEPMSKEIIKAMADIKTQASSSNDQHAILRLGKGKSYLFQVIMPFLHYSSQQKILGLMIKDKENRLNFPHTRVLNGYNKMFGWVKLAFPVFSLEDISFYDNIIENPLKDVTTIKAYFLENKKACFMLNGDIYPEVQLINKMKRTFEKGKEIVVTVHQISNLGKINQLIID